MVGSPLLDLGKYCVHPSLFFGPLSKSISSFKLIISGGNFFWEQDNDSKKIKRIIKNLKFNNV